MAHSPPRARGDWPLATWIGASWEAPAPRVGIGLCSVNSGKAARGPPRARGLTLHQVVQNLECRVRPALGDWSAYTAQELKSIVVRPASVGIGRTHSECAEADEGFSRCPTACWGLRKGRGRCSGKGGRYLAKRCGASPGGQTGPPIPPAVPQHRCNSVGGSELLLAGGEGRRVNAV